MNELTPPKTQRHVLPPRRPSINLDVTWRRSDGSQAVLGVGVGIDPASFDAKEIFAQGLLEGSDMQVLLMDACILVSLALQHGATIDGLAKTIVCENTDVTGSAIGAVLTGVTELTDQLKSGGQKS